MDRAIDNGTKVESSFKNVSRWASLIKDVLASVKDCGIIVFVLLVMFSREQVLGYLDSKGLRPSSLNLFGIELALDSLQVAGEAQQLGDLVAKAEPSTPLAEKAVVVVDQTAPKVEEIEKRVLSSPEAAVIGDWAIVVSGQPTLEQAQKAQAGMSFGPELQVRIFKKRDYFRLVVQIGSKDSVEPAVATVRKVFPGAYLVSLSRWCGSVSATSDYISCAAR